MQKACNVACRLGHPWPLIKWFRFQVTYCRHLGVQQGTCVASAMRRTNNRQGSRKVKGQGWIHFFQCQGSVSIESCLQGLFLKCQEIVMFEKQYQRYWGLITFYNICWVLIFILCFWQLYVVMSFCTWNYMIASVHVIYLMNVSLSSTQMQRKTARSLAQPIQSLSWISSKDGLHQKEGTKFAPT